MTMTNEPSSIVQVDAVQRAHLVGRAGLNVLWTPLRIQACVSGILRRRAAGVSCGRCRSRSGRTSATNTKAAVISFRSFGLRPPRSAMATSRRNSTEPMTAPVMTKPSCAGADERLADDDAGQAPHHHADAHLHVGEALVLREQGAGERDQAVRERQAEDDHVADVRRRGRGSSGRCRRWPAWRCRGWCGRTRRGPPRPATITPASSAAAPQASPRSPPSRTRLMPSPPPQTRPRSSA